MIIHTVEDFRKALRLGPYVWPGGYELFFIVDDGEFLCHSCAEDNRRQIADSIGTACNDGWRVIGFDAECNADGPVTCAHCYRTIFDDE